MIVMVNGSLFPYYASGGGGVNGDRWMDGSPLISILQITNMLTDAALFLPSTNQ